MATVRLGDGATVAMCDALVDLIDAGAGAGTIEIYTGTLPTDPDAAAAGTLLATLTYADPAYGNAAVSGTDASASIATAITGATSASGTGTAGWFRILDSNSNVVLIGDVTATSGGGALELDNTSISTGQEVNISSIPIAVHRDGTAT